MQLISKNTIYCCLRMLQYYILWSDFLLKNMLFLNFSPKKWGKVFGTLPHDLLSYVSTR